MKTLCITTYPYAVQTGYLDVPDNMPETQYNAYIREHWNNIEFGEADLDYAGTDIDIEVEDFE